MFVHRGDEALVLLRGSADAYWHVVAGGVEEGETFAAAAARELREEVGLDAAGRVHSLRRSYSYSVGSEEVSGECFAVEAAEGWEPSLDDEHSDYRWCSFEEAAGLVRRPEVADVLLLLRGRVRRQPRRRFTLRRPRALAVFFLRFASREAAEEAGAVLRADGYEVTIEQEPSHWLVGARGLVRQDSFDVAASAFAWLAEAKGGVYAGYRREEG